MLSCSSCFGLYKGTNPQNRTRETAWRKRFDGGLCISPIIQRHHFFSVMLLPWRTMVSMSDAPVNATVRSRSLCIFLLFSHFPLALFRCPFFCLLFSLQCAITTYILSMTSLSSTLDIFIMDDNKRAALSTVAACCCLLLAGNPSPPSEYVFGSGWCFGAARHQPPAVKKGHRYHRYIIYKKEANEEESEWESESHHRITLYIHIISVFVFVYI